MALHTEKNPGYLIPLTRRLKLLLGDISSKDTLLFINSLRGNALPSPASLALK